MIKSFANQMLVATTTCRLKLWAKRTTKQQHKVFDIKLCAPEVKRQFNIEPRNRFSALEIEDGEDQDIVKTTWSDRDRKSVSWNHSECPRL